jgi:adenosylmethionine-8-amino-7-oxononanoate aminotransferase
LTEDYGIYIYPGTGTVDGFKGDHVIVSPAFTITHADVDTIVERMVKLVEGFFDELDESCK